MSLERSVSGAESGCHKSRLERERQIGRSRSAHMLWKLASVTLTLDWLIWHTIV